MKNYVGTLDDLDKMDDSEPNTASIGGEVHTIFWRKIAIIGHYSKCYQPKQFKHCNSFSNMWRDQKDVEGLSRSFGGFW